MQGEEGSPSFKVSTFHSNNLWGAEVYFETLKL